jgi:DNA-binding CsgD family transcriptional regulator
MLSISVRTVEYHRANLTAKLNLRNRVDLMRYAEENDLI